MLSLVCVFHFLFFFSSRRRHTRCYRDWSSDVCSSDLDAVLGPGVEVVKELALPAEDGVGGDVDDGVDEVVAVIEVVVELAAAGAGACPDVVQAHAGGALLCEELGCGLEDPRACRAALRRCGDVR